MGEVYEGAPSTAPKTLKECSQFTSVQLSYQVTLTSERLSTDPWCLDQRERSEFAPFWWQSGKRNDCNSSFSLPALCPRWASVRYYKAQKWCSLPKRRCVVQQLWCKPWDQRRPGFNIPSSFYLQCKWLSSSGLLFLHLQNVKRYRLHRVFARIKWDHKFKALRAVSSSHELLKEIRFLLPFSVTVKILDKQQHLGGWVG